jgi:hypothetical protein
MQAIDQQGVPVVVADEHVELRMSDVGDMTVSFVRLAAGTDLGPALVGLEQDLCPCPHWGYMLEGQLLMRGVEGDTTYEAGQAFYWAPGHAPRALTDCAYVDFSPKEPFARVIRHIQGA